MIIVYTKAGYQQITGRKLPGVFHTNSCVIHYILILITDYSIHLIKINVHDGYDLLTGDVYSSAPNLVWCLKSFIFAILDFVFFIGYARIMSSHWLLSVFVSSLFFLLFTTNTHFFIQRFIFDFSFMHIIELLFFMFLYPLNIFW